MSDSDLLEIVEIASSKLNDSTDLLREYALVGDCPRSGDHKLTEKGEAACQDIFNRFVVRTRFELKAELVKVEKELKNIEHIYSDL